VLERVPVLVLVLTWLVFQECKCNILDILENTLCSVNIYNVNIFTNNVNIFTNNVNIFTNNVNIFTNNVNIFTNTSKAIL